MANLSFRLAENVRLNLAAGPYVAYSVGDKNIGKYNEYTPGYSGGYGAMALTIMVVTVVICMVTDG